VTTEQKATDKPTPQATAALAGETSGKAIGSLIAGVFGLLLFPASIAAIILGHISRSEIRKSAGRLKGAGIALAGLIFGYLGLAIPILIISAFVIPNLLRDQLAANEASAIGALLAINTAEKAYSATYPSKGYAMALSDLGQGGSQCGTPSPAHACLIDDSLAQASTPPGKSGYVFTAVGGRAQGGVNTTYYATATPIAAKKTGVRSFCSTEDGVVRIEPSGAGISSYTDCLNLQPLSQ
jgi:type IV pilus assembly protein PilA